MKNLNVLFWMCIYCLNAQENTVVITEFLTRSGSGTYLPDFVEIYNFTETPIDLEGWMINNEIIESHEEEIELETGEEIEVELNLNTIIPPKSYMIIADIGDFYANANGEWLYAGYNFPNSIYIPGFSLSHQETNIITITKNDTLIDSLIFSLDPDDGIEGWPDESQFRGHSLRLHDPNLDNNDSENWSISPKTDISPYLYDEIGDVGEIKNFGSPIEENSFKLLTPENNHTHYIEGDVYSDNNFADALPFAWEGTFSDEGLDLEYHLIFSKCDADGWNETYTECTDDSEQILIDIILGNQLTYFLDLEILEISQLMIDHFFWTVQLHKGEDIINSDKFNLTIDAQNYGVYGCTDEDACNYMPEANIDDNNCDSESCYGCMDFNAFNYDPDITNPCNPDCCQYITLTTEELVVGYQDSTEVLSIMLENNNGLYIESIHFEFEFNSTEVLLDYLYTTLEGTILDVWGFSIETIEDNNSVSVDILYSENAFPGGGIIANIFFDLIGDFGESTNITFSNFLINNIPVEINNSLITIQGQFEISGNVLYYDGLEINNVQFTLEDYDNNTNFYTQYSDLEGNFQFNEIETGNYILKPQKFEDFGGLTSTDASRIARYSIGAYSLDPHQVIAADVSLNGTVSGLDASRVARYVVDLPVNFNDDSLHWVFAPNAIEYFPLAVDDTSRNFYAYRLGDVNGTWNPDNLLSRSVQVEGIDFERYKLVDKESASLSVIIPDSLYIEGVDIEIGYDPSKINQVSINYNTDVFDDQHYNFLSNVNLKLKSAIWNISMPQKIGGVIAQIDFNCIGQCDNAKIWFDKFKINDKVNNGGFLISESNIISKAIELTLNTNPKKTSLAQNYPNPFNPNTTVSWTLENQSNIDLSIYNINGEVIDVLAKGIYNAGTFNVTWSGTYHPSGIYFSRLKVGDRILQNKMILLK